MASPERCRARPSNHLPSRISVTITAAVSKYTWPLSPTNAHTDQAQAAVVPRVTSVSIVVVRCRRFRNVTRWKSIPLPQTTGVARTPTTHSQPANCRAEIIDSRATGTVKEKAIRRGLFEAS